MGAVAPYGATSLRDVRTAHLYRSLCAVLSSQYEIRFVSRAYRRSNLRLSFAHWALQLTPSTGRCEFSLLRVYGLWPIRCYPHGQNSNPLPHITKIAKRRAFFWAREVHHICSCVPIRKKNHFFMSQIRLDEVYPVSRTLWG